MTKHKIRDDLQLQAVRFREETQREELQFVLAEARRRARLTQADVARAAGMSVRTVSRIEHGDPNVAIKFYLLVTAALGLRVELEKSDD